MRAIKVILVVACLAGVALAAPSLQNSRICEKFKESSDLEARWTSECKNIRGETEDEVGFSQQTQAVIAKSKANTFEKGQLKSCSQLRQTRSFGGATRNLDVLMDDILKESQNELSETCDQCKAGVARVKQHLSDFETKLLAECKKLPKQYQRLCVKSVKDYISYLSTHTPDEICQERGLCQPADASYRVAQPDF